MKKLILIFIPLLLASKTAKAPEVPLELQRDYFKLLEAHIELELQMKTIEDQLNQKIQDIMKSCGSDFILDTNEKSKGNFVCSPKEK